MPQIATRVTHVDLSAARVITTSSIKVYSIIISKTAAGAAAVTFRNNDDDILALLRVGTGNSFEWATPWIADNGLKIDVASSNIDVTILHSEEGI